MHNLSMESFSPGQQRDCLQHKWQRLSQAPSQQLWPPCLGLSGESREYRRHRNLSSSPDSGQPRAHLGISCWYQRQRIPSEGPQGPGGLFSSWTTLVFPDRVQIPHNAMVHNILALRPFKAVPKQDPICPQNSLFDSQVLRWSKVVSFGFEC